MAERALIIGVVSVSREFARGGVEAVQSSPAGADPEHTVPVEIQAAYPRVGYALIAPGPRQESLELAIKVGGEDKVLYGSDYPHNIGDMRGCLARVDGLPPSQRDAVRGGNAMRIFKL